MDTNGNQTDNKALGGSETPHNNATAQDYRRYPPRLNDGSWIPLVVLIGILFWFNVIYWIVVK